MMRDETECAVPGERQLLVLSTSARLFRIGTPRTKLRTTTCIWHSTLQSGVAHCRLQCNGCAHPPTRWSATLSSKVNLLHEIDLRAVCGANLVTEHPRISGQRNPRTQSCGMTIPGCFFQSVHIRGGCPNSGNKLTPAFCGP